MRLLSVLADGLKSGLLFWLQVTAIVVTLVIFLEWLRQRGLFERAAEACRPASRLLGISKEAIFPLLIGLTFGLTLGAAIIIQEAKRGIISRRDMFLVGIFVGLCHSLPEDTFLFMRLGANGAILAGARLAVALLVTLALGRGVHLLARRNGGGATDSTPGIPAGPTD